MTQTYCQQRNVLQFSTDTNIFVILSVTWCGGVCFFLIPFLSDKLINLAMRLKYGHLSSYHATRLCLFIDINREQTAYFHQTRLLKCKLRQETFLVDNSKGLGKLLCGFLTPQTYRSLSSFWISFCSH